MLVRAYLLGATLVAALGLAAPGRADDACAPWPGEFQPLPQVDDADPLRARFARLRAERLAERATGLEGQDRVEANRLWQRVRCFDAASAAARAGIARTHPAVVQRVPTPPRPEPAVASKPAVAPKLAAVPKPAVAPKRAAVRKPAVVPEPSALAKSVAAPAPVPPASPRTASPDLAPLAASLTRVEEQLRSARFDEALADLETLRGRIVQAGDSPPVRAQRVRLEVLTATAHVAYGDEAAARASLRRALAVDPRLDFDAGRTPPKLRRALEAARSGTQP